jgi:hypothetical protein
MVALLCGCSSYESSTSWLNHNTSSAFDGVANMGERVGAPWGGTRPRSPGESLTVQRVTGAYADSQPLLPEPGNVWPAPEAPRATLMNPDQALRGIPGYEPGAPPPVALPQPGGQGEEQQPPRPTRRRGTGGPFVPAPTSGAPEPPPPQATLPQLPPLPPLPDRAPGGQVIQTPQGGLTPSTQSGNVSTFNTPGGPSGTITRDGNNVIINRPGEPPQILPAPR